MFSKIDVFFLILMDTCAFLGQLIPHFWTFGNVSSGFQSQSGQPYLYLAEAYVMHVCALIALTCLMWLYSYFLETSRNIGAFSLCILFLLLSIKLPVRVVPHGMKGTGPMVRHETSVFEIP